MKKSLFLPVVLVLALGGLVSCVDEVAYEGEPELEFQVSALSSACSTGASSDSVARYRVMLVDRSQSIPRVVQDKTVKAGESSVKMKSIPQGSNLELTFLGLGELGDRPLYFGRARNLQVLKNQTTTVDLTLGKYGDYSCLAVPPGAPNSLFPTVTALPDGRVLIAGGFTKVKEDTGSFEVYNPTDRSYVYDPATGEMRQTRNVMNLGRAAHSAIYLPSGYVLLAGGVDRLFLEKNSGSKFPWYFLKDKAGTVGRTYELFDVNEEKFLVPGVDWPDEGNEMNRRVRRVFPAMALNNDGTVLVTGGGQWKSIRTEVESDPDYRVAELYVPASESTLGRFADTSGALTMRAMRTGHTAVLMDVRDKLSYHLFWGGSADGPVAEYYIESSDQVGGNWGLFKDVTFVDTNSYRYRPYFHTMIPIGSREFLVAGGLTAKDGPTDKPGELELPSKSANHSFLIKLDDEYRVSVKAVPGLGFGRYFHSMVAYDNNRVMVLGGFGGGKVGDNEVYSTTAMSDRRFFDAAAGSWFAPSEDLDSPLIPRAGMGTLAIGNDCVLLLGGADHVVESLEFGSTSAKLVAEQYCASIVCPEPLWSTGCYVK